MAVKRNGLGKGLDSLIPNKNDKVAKASVKTEELRKKTDEIPSKTEK